ncbi:transcriptional regulator GcvA [Aliivibrio fischeri]|uniref:DNA-binding transcriptional dual regulator, glycine cleavage system transcriptional activator n=4 Tax=Aliivibrio fischeri TaxID=668 RepID=Q5E7B0_ALIF1|nr:MULTISPECIES: transcriptional regulator GcvA [Aliivibrio]AAW85086.1 DNA-binding transcriptional dual regulator, glycine cleavage system transcriptional activator [Aliivibrio fischeri ES114]ACH67072.1 glycine cleavage system transcriptional activator [Aliivibrio fischeri MJ11]EHN70814.1 DNA-binding transcriptional activator GcvA [Aliivibrio fischeri SR5]KLU77343.1 transcriptional regulator [Aliivibrio fischeri]MBD1571124.1 transcriptional regulator GcvA [Aliivibrio sp. S10_S31]
MSRRLPPLNSLRVFEAAARHLSFTRAAEELFVTQAAVSHQIKALEEFLGLKLFRRRNRSLLLTEEGQSYFLDIKEIFSSLSEATDKVLERSAKGALTISLPPSFAIQWLVPRLSDFNNQEPDIDVRIKAVDMDEGSLTEDVDVAIYYGRGNWPGLRVELLYQEQLLPLCSPQVLLNEKPLATIDDLRFHTLLHDTSRKDWKQFVKHYELAGMNVNQGPIFSHSTMVLQAAAHGQGIALGNNVLAQPELDAGRLVAPFEEVLVSKNAFYLVCNEKQADTGRIATFREWILSKARSEQEIVDDE